MKHKPKAHWPKQASKRAEMHKVRTTFDAARRVPEFYNSYEFERTRLSVMEELPTFRLTYLVGMYGRPARAMEFLTMIETPLVAKPSATEPKLPVMSQITVTHKQLTFLLVCVAHAASAMALDINATLDNMRMLRVMTTYDNNECLAITTKLNDLLETLNAEMGIK